MKKKTILLVDDHQLFLAGLRDMMAKHQGYAVDTHSDIQSVKLLNLHSYDILITDLNMPGSSGFDLIQYAKKENPQLHCVVLSIHDGIGHIKKAKELGAVGYLLKEESEATFIHALESLDKNDFFLSERLKDKLQAIQPSQKILTPREEQILKLIVKNKQNSEISEKLSISENTVKTHRKNILAKLRSSNIDSLNAYAKEYLTL